MALRRRHGGALPQLNLVPVIDLFMVLTAFPVLTFGVAQDGSRSLPVALPQAGSAERAAIAELEIAVDRAGRITSAGRDLELADLPGFVASRPRVTVLADVEARHGRVVAVVDALRRAGVREVFYGAAGGPAGVVDW